MTFGQGKSQSNDLYTLDALKKYFFLIRIFNYRVLQIFLQVQLRWCTSAKRSFARRFVRHHLRFAQKLCTEALQEDLYYV